MMASSRPRPPAWDVVVAGAGIPGLTLALALARALPGALRVTVLDPAAHSRRVEPRAYALSPASRNLLVALGLWDRLAGDVQPIRGMTITDGQVEDAVRPEYLRFGSEEDAALGFMIEGGTLQGVLAAAAVEAGTTLEFVGVSDFRADERGVAVDGSDGLRRNAHLLVAADGSRSRLRDLAGIDWYGRRYSQVGIVATVGHEHDHGGRAVQHFLPGGPVAILPLQPGPASHRSSLVWTERDDAAPALLSLPREEAAQEVARRIGPELGAITLETDLVAHPLSWGLARIFAAPRFALLGDAAHAIHPLAGQGLNLALGGAAALAERIVDAVRLGLDPGGADVLAAYDRDRRFDAVALTATTDALNRLFSNDALPLRVLRDLGLGLVDRSATAKGFFSAQAAGTASRAPRLMRGEPL